MKTNSLWPKWTPMASNTLGNCAWCGKTITKYALQHEIYCCSSCQKMAKPPKCHFCERAGRIEIDKDISICTYCFNRKMMPNIKSCEIIEHAERNVHNLCHKCLRNKRYQGEVLTCYAGRCKECIDAAKP